MAKKVSISINAVIAGMILVAACMAAIVYQNRLYDELFQEYVDIKWSNTNTEANLVYVRKKLEKCTADTPATTAAGS
ncbi:MAG: hypothetical protein OEU51_01820 [Gammaproteobacteria bacterium]|jgi:hypothetical protein|nr:hypothetical protein [Gammaproteobacteria bacterium]